MGNGMTSLSEDSYWKDFEERYRYNKAVAHAYERLRTLLPDAFEEYLEDELSHRPDDAPTQ